MHVVTIIQIINGVSCKVDGNNVSLKRDKTFSFICSFHTPLVSEVQLNECGDQQWGLWGGGCTEGTVCVFFFFFLKAA